MMIINPDTYELIVDLLDAKTGLESLYSIEEIAEMLGISVDVVEYVSRTEYGVL